MRWEVACRLYRLLMSCPFNRPVQQSQRRGAQRRRGRRKVQRVRNLRAREACETQLRLRIMLQRV